MPVLDAADYALANRWQRGFPLVPRPFREVGAQSSLSEEEALENFRDLASRSVIDRVGPVFRPNTVGASSLAAMAVPAERLEDVAGFVSAQPGVNHNYQRDHACNLWFVVTGTSEAQVQWTLSCIEYATGLPVLRLPLLEEFHIDLGFDLATGNAPREKKVPGTFSQEKVPGTFSGEKVPDTFSRKLVGATASGLPLVSRPYEAVGARLGVPEQEVIEGLKAMLEDGRIRRLGAVVRHRRLGFTANAMAVWDVPDDAVAALGAALAAEPAVTLCYRRARALPHWPYNLYCMVHGRERPAVDAELARIAARHGLDAWPHARLFSERCFSQKAASYGDRDG